MRERIGEYLIVEKIGCSATGKTDVWGVWNKDESGALGQISWNGGWRCYWFCPNINTGYEKKCLRSIADFCEHLTELHRIKKKEKR